MIKHNFFNSPYQKGFLILPLIFIFVGFISCSIGTDKSASLPERPLNKLKFNKEGQMIELEHRTASAKATMAEGSGIKTGGHPPIDDNKIIHRKIVVPLEVENRWKAVKLLIQNKKGEKNADIQIVELGDSLSPEGSELKVTVGPFLPNFMMDKTTYTSMGNDELNPAVQLVVEENGKIIYKGWAFKSFPSMSIFEHQVFSIKLLGAVPAVVS